MDLMNYYFGHDVKIEGDEYSGDPIIKGSAETIEENVRRSYFSFLEELEKEYNEADTSKAEATPAATDEQKKEGGDFVNNMELDFADVENDDIRLDFAGAADDDENINLIFEDDVIEQ